MRAGIDRAAHLLERHRQVEVRVGVVGVERQRDAIRRFRVRVAPVIVMDVAEIEVRLEVRVVQRDGPLVERLRLGQLVARVADVGEIDQRGDQIRILFERAAVGLDRLLDPLRRAIVQERSHQEILLGRAQWAEHAGADGAWGAWGAKGNGALGAGFSGAKWFGRRGFSSRMRAGCASRRKSNVSWPVRDDCSVRTTARNGVPCCSSPAIWRSAVRSAKPKKPLVRGRSRLHEPALLEIAEMVEPKGRDTSRGCRDGCSAASRARCRTPRRSPGRGEAHLSADRMASQAFRSI